MKEYTKFSDIELFEAVAIRSDTTAFNELFERFWKRLYATAIVMIKDEQEAKDCVQATFVTLWEKRAAISISTSVSSYLNTSVRNRILNTLREKAIRNNQPLVIPQLDLHYYASPPNRLEDEELKNIIETEVTKMPDQMRRIYQMSRNDQLTVREISETLNLSSQTVKNQISLALSKIRDVINHYHGS